jgi:hypothetical protein
MSNLSKLRGDWSAPFAPALNAAYAKFASEVQQGIPSALTRAGVFNFFDWTNGLFQQDWALVSAGEHLSKDTKAILSMKAPPVAAFMLQNRDRSKTKVVCDSGGFQIQQGTWKFKSYSPDERKAICKMVFRWQQSVGDFALPLDIPTGCYMKKSVAGRAGYNSFKDCLAGTLENLEWFFGFSKILNPDLKLLNVLQGDTEEERIAWFNAVKAFRSDGWALSYRAFGKSTEDVARMLRMLRLEQKLGHHLHILGTCATDAALEFSILQNIIRQHYEHNYTITFDASTPFTESMRGKILQVSNREVVETIWLPQNLPANLPFPLVNSPVSRLITSDDMRGNGTWTEIGHGLATSHNLYTYLEHYIQQNNQLQYALHHASACNFKTNYMQRERILSNILI